MLGGPADFSAVVCTFHLARTLGSTFVCYSTTWLLLPLCRIPGDFVPFRICFCSAGSIDNWFEAISSEEEDTCCQNIAETFFEQSIVMEFYLSFLPRRQTTRLLFGFTLLPC